jgi:hypothetical protein
MNKAVEKVGESVLKEAADELAGRSTRKWGVILVAFVLGALGAVAAIKAWQQLGAQDAGGGSTH